MVKERDQQRVTENCYAGSGAMGVLICHSQTEGSGPIHSDIPQAPSEEFSELRSGLLKLNLDDTLTAFVRMMLTTQLVVAYTYLCTQ